MAFGIGATAGLTGRPVILRIAQSSIAWYTSTRTWPSRSPRLQLPWLWAMKTTTSSSRGSIQKRV